MLSAQFIRENLDRVQSDLAARGADAPIDSILALDQQRRALIGQVEGLRAERNTASKAIGATKDADERAERIAAARALGEKLDGFEAQLRETEASLQGALYEVPNILDATTPPGADESENVTVKTVGAPREFDFEPRPHWEVGEALDGIDFARGVKMSGSRFFVLRGGIAGLHRALIAVDDRCPRRCRVRGALPAVHAHGRVVPRLGPPAEVPREPLPGHRGRLPLHSHRGGPLREPLPRRNPGAGVAAPPVRGAHPLLPPREDERRTRHARPEARPPVREGGDVRLLRAGAERRGARPARWARLFHSRSARRSLPRPRTLQR